jgi:alpha-L-rhamnosidase
LQVEAQEGERIMIATDNYLFYCPEVSVRAEYITRKGIQAYECPGWMNGHKVYYFIPKGVKVISLQYRETGYNTSFDGSFTSSEPFLNKLWEKARRTLYINMRDTYMDCPERERAQWTGDAVNESGQAFYALSPSSHALTKKWLYELVNWQRDDSSMYAPVPAGNWNGELPGQVAASVGYYGLWNYYLHTGDKTTVAALYNGVQRYLDSWVPDGKGTMQFRTGDWTWGDWGEERDMLLLFNLWYYLAVKGMHHMALTLGNTSDATRYAAWMQQFEVAFNQQFWTGTAYRDPAYKGKTDDRAQALAVVAGIAGKEKYPLLLKVFQTEEHASPYMEKYVFEAMFQMGYVKEALARHEKRFSGMVNYPGFTTLFEGWGIGKEGFGGGTVNHAWSGGGLTVLSQYLCGIAPLEPAYKTFQIIPQPGTVKNASATIASVAGKISSSFTNLPGKFTLVATVPAGTTAIIGIPDNGYRKILLDNKVVWEKGQFRKHAGITGITDGTTGAIRFSVSGGEWHFMAVK